MDNNYFLDPKFIGNSFADGSGSISTEILEGLVWYYTLDELTGNRLDSSTSGLTLSQVGTVSQGPGIIGNSASFNGTIGNVLTHATDALYDLSATDFTHTGWFLIDDKSVDRVVQDIGNSLGDSSAFIGYFQATDSFGVTVNNGTTPFTLTQQITGSIPIGVPVFYAVRYDESTNTLELRLDAQAFTNTTTTGSIQNPTNTVFNLGSRVDTTDPWDGLIDEVGGWDRLLTDEEVDFLYNGGAGQRPFLPIALIDNEANELEDDLGNILVT